MREPWREELHRLKVGVAAEDNTTPLWKACKEIVALKDELDLARTNTAVYVCKIRSEAIRSVADQLEATLRAAPSLCGFDRAVIDYVRDMAEEAYQEAAKP